MNKKRIITWIIIVNAALCAGYVLFAVGAIITHYIRAEHARQQIINANPGELLDACREMINNREKVLREVPLQFKSGMDIRFRYSDGIEYIDNVPTIIREMKPMWIEIKDYRVQVHVQPLPRTGFVGYIEGEEKQDAMPWDRLHMITNGLWFYDH